MVFLRKWAKETNWEQRIFRDGVARIGVSVVHSVIYLYGGIVAQFVRPNDLYVHLYGSGTYPLGDTLHVVERIGAGIYEVIERPSYVSVSQTVVYRFIPYQSEFCVILYYQCLKHLWTKDFTSKSPLKIGSTNVLLIEELLKINFTCQPANAVHSGWNPLIVQTRVHQTNDVMLTWMEKK